MIVVEGCDGCGKTTLVKHLSQKYKLLVGERGVANRDFLYKVTRQDTYRALATAVKADSPPLIWDRLWVSEYVYHGVHPGRPCEFNSYETAFIWRIINTLHCPMIVCLPPYEVVRENVRAAHQMEGVKEGLPEIYLAYEGGELPWPKNTVWYDYTGQKDHFATLEDVEEEIEGYFLERREREAWEMNFWRRT